MTWWGTPREVREAQTAVPPALGEAAIDLAVSAGPVVDTASVTLAEGIRSLYENGVFCDVVMHCGDERFPAHRAMVAAMSPPFSAFLLCSAVTAGGPAVDPMEDMLCVRPRGSPSPPALAVAVDTEPPVPVAIAELPKDPPSEPLQVATSDSSQPPPAPAPAASTSDSSQPPPAPAPAASEEQAPTGAVVAELGANDSTAMLELQVNGIVCPSAVKILLDFVYYVGTDCDWNYEPASSEINKDVLRLARRFSLQNLHERAARWVATGVTTKNIVDRLVTCHDFGLHKLRERIMESLISNPAELATVSGSLEIMKHPRLLQDLLVQVASVCRAGPPPPKNGPATDVQDDQEKVVDKPGAKRRKRDA